MAKTYAPQLAKMLKAVVRYDAKHHSRVASVATTQQMADLQTILNAINNSWASVNTTQVP